MATRAIKPHRQRRMLPLTVWELLQCLSQVPAHMLHKPVTVLDKPAKFEANIAAVEYSPGEAVHLIIEEWPQL